MLHESTEKVATIKTLAWIIHKERVQMHFYSPVIYEIIVGSISETQAGRCNGLVWHAVACSSIY